MVPGGTTAQACDAGLRQEPGYGSISRPAEEEQRGVRGCLPHHGRHPDSGRRWRRKCRPVWLRTGRRCRSGWRPGICWSG